MNISKFLLGFAVCSAFSTSPLRAQSSFDSADVRAQLSSLIEQTKRLQQELALQRAESVANQTARYAVGSVQQSFLTEAQFQAQMGPGWVLCDGRDLTSSQPNSKWQTVTGSSSIPDCRGRFLRTVGGASSALGQLQEDATAVNGLRVSSSSSVSRALNVSVSGTLSGRLEVSGHGAFSGRPVWWGNSGKGTGLTFTNTSTTAHNGVHAIYPVVNGTMTGSASGGAIATSSTISSGDSETRPVNITVNTFIKIN